jgi:transcriptional regulator with XRE-family HTH domain
MTPDARLGQFLRARRELVRPEDVGLETVGRRRVAGLRREEVATLAGISSDYYLRLEQGRGHRPSARVLAALARALQLDEQASAHMQTLSRPSTERRRPIDIEGVSAHLAHLLTLWTTTPAFVESRYMDVLAANDLAVALSPAFVPGVNIVRAVFLDEELRGLLADWEDVARTVVAQLRSLTADEVEDLRLSALVGELSGKSPEFERLWARHDVHARGIPSRVFNHPHVGRLELRTEKFFVSDTAQLLIVYHAEPGTASAEALRRLVGSD